MSSSPRTLTLCEKWLPRRAPARHPQHHRGLGYAGALSRVVAGEFLASGEAPFLHVYAHNTDAIALYQKLGLTLRREMYMQVLTHA